MTATFDPPGPGSWDLDRSHYDAALTPLGAELMEEATDVAYRKLFAALGVPAATVEMRTVNGFVYTRIRPYFGGGRNVTKAPPDVVVRLIFRLHPEMRRREKLAQHAFDAQTFRTVLREWEDEIKPRLEARNRELQSADLPALDDRELVRHLESCIAHVRATFEEHHRLHGYDLGPLGQWVVFALDHDISPGDALSALVGASPSTVEPKRQLAEMRAAVEAAGIEPATLDDVRSVSPEVSAALDAYLERHGSVLYASYDFDGSTLGERPEVILRTIMSATADTHDRDADRVAADLRARVPSREQAEFDRLLAAAREAMDMRDDNGPLTVEWPSGLLRLAMLEGGRRLSARGRLTRADHVFELDREQLLAMLRHDIGPSSEEVTDLAAARRAQRDLDPPARLGPDPIEPPLHLLPPSMARAMGVTMKVMETLSASTDDLVPLSGTGIGSEPFTGVARVAASAEEAMDRLEPGEILVTRVTSPAFNLVISLAGGLATAEGGPMAHAAVLSRELGLPAVVGVRDIMDHVRDGDHLRLDPAAGTVEILTPG